jgi:hypothetical protein
MNRFRTKKKGKDGADIVERSASPSIPPLKSSKTFRLGRKNVQEPERKLELDLANALPPSDDFRTSLLMSGLSARFSMLREQDDPKSKIGKASDDSVLFPKRQSRLNDFGFQSHGLSDIAEVSSIRAPFASGRVDSFHSTDSNYGEEGSSIMSRAKPGEGNNLFGGRQKIYKIPAGANGDKGMSGRALYDDDVSLSAFQKLRQREREQREREQNQRDQDDFNDSEQSLFPLRSASPPLSGYNRNRETSSTTSSGPSLTRSSTAATSVTSNRSPSVNGHSSPSTPSVPNQTNGMDRSMTKGKRLYETGLDHHLHNQQYSAMNRLDTLSRQQTFGARTPSPSAGPHLASGYEYNNANGSTAHHIGIRSASPPPTAATLGTFDFSVKSATSVESQKSLFVAPPLSPPISDGDEQTTLPIQPNDRGKATALGAFSKPVQPYDEKKYMQRQLQMQQGRETPPMQKHSPPRIFHPRHQPAGRPRTESTSTYSSGSSRSSSSAQSQHTAQNRIMAPQTEANEDSETEEPQISTGTFLDSPAEPPVTSLDKADALNEKSWDHVAPQKLKAQKLLQEMNETLIVQRPLESQHPAHRQPNPRIWKDYTADTKEAESPTITVAAAPTNIDKRLSEHKDPPADSPTLGPGNGLSGLVRQHLRTDSNTSSVYGAPSPGLASMFPRSQPETTDERVYNSQGNPWEFNDWDQGITDRPNLVQQAINGGVNTISPGKTSSSVPSRTKDSPKKLDEVNQNNSWEDEVAHGHTRNGSSDTQKERVDFANELASARRRVQQNLKTFAESDHSRSTSPAPTMNSEREGVFSKNNPIGMLKSKSSRDSMLAKSRNGQAKAMKMLGLGNSTEISSASPGKQRLNENPWKEEEEEMLRGIAKAPKNPPPTKSFRQARRDAQRERERQVLLRRHQQQQDGGSRSSGESDGQTPVLANIQPRQYQPSQGVGPAPPGRQRAPSQESKSTSRSGSRPPSRNARNRSSSDASGRSKSRNGRYRDDLAKAMAEGHGSSAQGAYDDISSSRVPHRSPALPHLHVAPSPGGPFSGRSRSNSKSTPGADFDAEQVEQIQSLHPMDMGMSPRPSPVQPFAANTTPALAPPSPFVPGINSPSTQGFQSQQGRIPTNLKRTVNKSDISEPKLVSKTSHIVTVDLPVSASLQNRMPTSAPPLPPQDPRRRQTRTQAVFGGLIGKSNDSAPSPSMPTPNYYEEASTFSADEGDQNRWGRQKLRKSSSEGGNMNARARQVFAATPSPALPGFPAVKTREGGMF